MRNNNEKFLIGKKSYILYIICCLWFSFQEVHAQVRESRASVMSRNLEVFNDLYKQLDLYYVDSLSADTVIRWAIEGMLSRVDPYTVYYPREDEELRQLTTGKYAGIGSVVSLHKKENRVVISEPFWDSPCQRAGVKMGDVILSVDKVDTKGMSVEEVRNMLRGEAGTTLRLQIKRKGEKKPLTIKINREVIKTEELPYYGMLNEEVGYICFSNFVEGAYKQVKHALLDLKAQGAKKLILDLRDNPGGSLTEAVDISNLFVAKGEKIVTIKGKLPSTYREMHAAMEPIDTVMPLVLLTSRMSASASEIVCGCLQDLDRALIVGTRTFGKGLVQSIRELPFGENLKITTSRYYIPSGRCIQALDYRHLNPDGSAGAIPDSLTHEFHTRNGRTVRDGGGIMPDVEVVADSVPTFIYELLENDAFFDYVVDYASHHDTIAQAGKISLTDEEYTHFVEYIYAEGVRCNRQTERILSDFRKIAKLEGYLPLIEENLDSLQAKLQTDVRTDLYRFKNRIKHIIETQLAQCYYYQKGFIQQYITQDKTIHQAIECLNNEKRFKELLQNRTKKQ